MQGASGSKQTQPGFAMRKTACRACGRSREKNSRDIQFPGASIAEADGLSVRSVSRRHRSPPAVEKIARADADHADVLELGRPRRLEGLLGEIRGTKNRSRDIESVPQPFYPHDEVLGAFPFDPAAPHAAPFFEFTGTVRATWREPQELRLRVGNTAGLV